MSVRWSLSKKPAKAILKPLPVSSSGARSSTTVPGSMRHSSQRAMRCSPLLSCPCWVMFGGSVPIFPIIALLPRNKAAQPDRKQERVWLGQLLGSLGILGCGCYRHPAFQLILRPRGGCSPTIPHVVFLISYLHGHTYGLCAHYLRSHPLFPHSP